jgi:hypothetical protein
MRHRASRMLAATLVLVGAASCGSGGSSTNERPAVRERGRNTTTVPNAIGIVKDALSGSRAADTANFVGSFFFDATALGTEDPAAGRVSLGAKSAEYTVDMQGEQIGLVPPSTPLEEIRMRVREADGALYLRFPAAFESAGVGDRWVRIDTDAAPTGAALPKGFEDVSLRTFLAARLLRPEMCFRVISDAATARLVGPETVRGAPTTRYAVEWAPRKWAEDAGLFFFFGPDRSEARLAALDAAFARATTADVWIDDVGRVRRVVGYVDLTLVAPHFDPPGDPDTWRELRTKCEFFDYGTEVPAIDVPSDVAVPATGG